MWYGTEVCLPRPAFRVWCSISTSPLHQTLKINNQCTFFCHFTSVFKLRWQRAPAGNDQKRYNASVYVQSIVETAASRSDKQFHRRLQGQPHSAAADVDNSGGGSWHARPSFVVDDRVDAGQSALRQPALPFVCRRRFRRQPLNPFNKRMSSNCLKFARSHKFTECYKKSYMRSIT